MNNPYNYAEINAYNSTTAPSTVHVRNTGLARFFKRYLLQEAISRFEFKLPETFDMNYFTYVLFVIGHIAVISTDKYGVIPQHCGLGGFTVQYQPFWTTINNPLIEPREKYIIGKDCALIKLQPDYCGLYDIVDYYGDLMALTAETAGVNILNSKLSYVFGATNKAQAESMKKMYDQIASGEPASFIDKSLFDEDGKLTVTMLTQNVGQNFIADRLLDALGTIRNMFLTDIGIENANTDKRERLISDEVNANNAETESKVSLWLETLEKGFEQVRKMYGLTKRQMSVKLRKFEATQADKEVVDNGEPVNSRTV